MKWKDWQPKAVGDSPEKDWRKKFEAAAKRGAVYCFGSKVLLDEVKRHQKILSDGHFCDFAYNTQYDICMMAYLFYDRYVELHEWMPREELFWLAVELRYPVYYDELGRPRSRFMRNPWAEHIVYGLTYYEHVAAMGAAGCGKTQVFLTWNLMCWEMYMGVSGDGGRCIFASVTEAKLKAAAFSHLTDAIRSSASVGTYVGRGETRSSIQVRRPNMMGVFPDGTGRNFGSDDKGIMVGLLLGGVSEANIMKKVDTVTGSHSPHFLGVVLDEFQSCSTAAYKAISNLKIHPRICRIGLAGNLGRKDDPLGLATPPADGWDSIDEDHCCWIGKDQEGQEIYVIRFDNDRSPGVKDPDKYWYLPTIEKRDKVFPTEASRKTPGYARFWRGQFPSDEEEGTILSPTILENTGATRDPVFVDYKYPVTSFCSLDSAPESIDRSILGIFDLMVENDRRLVLWARRMIELPKYESTSFLRKTSEEISKIMSQEKILPHDIILDDTGSTGFDEILRDFGIRPWGVKFNSAATGELVDVNTSKTGSDQCVNLRAEMALLLQRYAFHGQLRGITTSLVPEWRRELCTMRFMDDNPRGKKQVEPKKDFKIRMGFSPDVLDVMMMAALKARQLGLLPGALGDQLKYNKGMSSSQIEADDEVYHSPYTLAAESRYDEPIDQSLEYSDMRLF